MLQSRQFSTRAIGSEDAGERLDRRPVSAMHQLLSDPRRRCTGGTLSLPLIVRRFGRDLQMFAQRRVGDMETGATVTRMISQRDRRQDQVHGSRIGQRVSALFAGVNSGLLQHENKFRDLFVGASQHSNRHFLGQFAGKPPHTFDRGDLGVAVSDPGSNKTIPRKTVVSIRSVLHRHVAFEGFSFDGRMWLEPLLPRVHSRRRDRIVALESIQLPKDPVDRLDDFRTTAIAHRHRFVGIEPVEFSLGQIKDLGNATAPSENRLLHVANAKERTLRIVRLADRSGKRFNHAPLLRRSILKFVQ